MTNLNCKFTQLKRQIQAERVVSVGEKLENNSKRVQSYVSDLEKLASSRNDLTVTRTNSSENFLSFRMDNPIYIYVENNGFADRDYFNREEVPYPTTAKFPLVERMPPFTTWIFLDRNQRMIDDQSVAGRRQIYYEKHGGEALVCSDSEEDHGELTLPKHEFSEGEDRIIRVAFQECGAGDEVINTLTQFVRGTSTEIQERFNMLEEKDKMIDTTCVQEGSEDNVILNKSLSAALDSFDNLFCRRCLVFDCRLHGCSQNLVYPSEKHSNLFDPEDERKPCGDQCYLWFNGLKDLIKRSAVPLDGSQRKVSDDEEQESKRKNDISEPTDSVMMSSMVVLDDFHKDNADTLDCPLDVSADKVRDKGKDIAEIPLENRVESSRRIEWKPLEKDLYLKGLEIFGRNSCLIARSLLSGLKTCKEVSNYMYGDGAAMVHGSSAVLRSFFEDIGKSDMGFMEADMGVKSRVCRKRGRARKVKSSWKSAGHPSLWRRIIDGKDEPYKQYSPCNCEPVCGKQCPCQLNGTCCEKYCGCSKGCKNRFRGCHCAKSQCKSRQCPCFAARRECDPDVCRNCWISCGDGSLGESPRRGEGQCGNMRLLLRQQQRILLAKSDVAGWGAFIKNSVNKNDYLGEYTGELISHQEADKRGKIYDRTNSSFLFDLNDQYVLDAYRKGDKLKFANHSPTPNCYAKVMLVAGDHRVGIFANERIEGGEELFYDYRYGPDQAPAWARKPESGSKRDSSLQHQGRAKKHQSG